MYFFFFFLINLLSVNDHGQLGIGNEDDHSSAIKMKFDKSIKDAAAGECYTLLLTKDNNLFKTGMVYAYPCHTIPTKIKVPGSTNEKIIKISGGYKHFLAVGSQKNVFGMGKNTQYQLTNFLPNPTHYLTLIPCLRFDEEIISVHCGWYHSLIRLKTNVIMGIGESSYFGGESNKNVDENGLVTVAENISEIHCGKRQTLLIGSDGVYVAGCNHYGCLGLGHRNGACGPLQKSSLISNLIRARKNKILAFSCKMQNCRKYSDVKIRIF